MHHQQHHLRAGGAEGAGFLLHGGNGGQHLEAHEVGGERGARG
jgi:hypothetical protein